MTEIIMLNLKNLKIWDTPQWRTIAHERNENKINDDVIYFYVNDEVDFDKLKVGETIQLDEEFEIIEIQKLEK